jgi:selenoprotein W-related protein
MILEEFEHSIDDFTLIPSKGGVFEVNVDGALIYSKKATGTHADPKAVLAQIRTLAR